MNNPQFISEFKPFGLAHFIVIGLTIFLSILLSVVVRKSASVYLQKVISVTIAILLVGVEGFNYYYSIQYDGWDYFLHESLPLHACGVALYLTAYMLITKRQAIFEIVYFWAFAGTTQAILTPVTQEGFPSWHCFHFFFTHGLVVVGAAYATFGLQMRPRWKGVWITYAYSWGLLFVVGVANQLLGTNYMYLCEKPSGQTPFYFLPWPWYIPFLGLVALVFFYLLWLPFGWDVSRLSRKRDCEKRRTLSD